MNVVSTLDEGDSTFSSGDDGDGAADVAEFLSREVLDQTFHQQTFADVRRTDERDDHRRLFDRRSIDFGQMNSFLLQILRAKKNRRFERTFRRKTKKIYRRNSC